MHARDDGACTCTVVRRPFRVKISPRKIGTYEMKDLSNTSQISGDEGQDNMHKGIHI